MKLLLFLLIAVSAFGQSSATLQFAGTNVGSTITVNPNGFTPEIQGIEIQGQVAGCSGVTLTSQITNASTSFPVTTIPAGCTILPGWGLALGCVAGGGSCTEVATVKAAGCSAGSCPVVQHQLGTSGGSFAAGSAVTVLWGGDGNNFLCNRVILPYLVYLANLGAATVNAAPVPGLGSTPVTTQNAAMAIAVSINNSTIAGAFSCTPSQ